MGNLLFVIFVTYLYVSISSFVFLIIRYPKILAYKAYKDKPWVITCILGTLIALSLILAEGLKKFLFFIPYSWGEHNEYGEWESARIGLSYLLGSIFSYYIIWLIGEVQRKENVIQKLYGRYTGAKGHTDSGDR